MTEPKSPTSLVWLISRTYCTGTPEDYAAVHALQDAMKLQPLGTWGQDYVPPPGKVDPAIDMKTAVRDQVNALRATEFFTLLAELMKRNPPAAADAPAVERFAQLGLAPGQAVDPARFGGLADRRLPELSQERIKLHFLSRDGDFTRESGWSSRPALGSTARTTSSAR
jgi:hypothetical protein